jgi:hypothetical protein
MIYKGDLSTGINETKNSKDIMPSSISTTESTLLVPKNLQFYRLKLMDIAGKTVGASLNEGLNISKLNNGLYLWSVVSANGETFTGKTLIR